MSDKSDAADAALAIWQLQTDILMAHGVDLVNRSFCINENIEQKLFETVNAKMAMLERSLGDSELPITIKLNSGGGDVYTAWAIVSRIKSSPCEVIVEAHGCVASSATMILMCADVRRASKYCTFMIHEASVEVGGKLSEIKDSVEEWKKEEKMYTDFLVKYSKKNRIFWTKVLQLKRDLYLTAPELLKLGIIDEVF